MKSYYNMRCCVSYCKNDSRHLSKSQGITFHVFPTEPSLRVSWLIALDKGSWQPKERSAVCSEHFNCEDLYETKSGLRKVRSGAVPVMFKDIPYKDPTSVKVCRICLVMNCKLISIRKYRLDAAFEILTGLRLRDETALPQRLCCECAQRLISCHRLRDRSLRAHSLMMAILQNRKTITEQSIESIDRVTNDLASNLRPKHNQPDHYDLEIEYDEYHTEIGETELMSVDDTATDPNDSELKNYENDVTIKDEVSNEVYFSENEIPDNLEDYKEDDREDDKEDSDVPLALEKKRSKPKKKPSRRKHVKKKVTSEPKVDRRRKPLNDDLNESLFTITDLTFEEQIEEILKRRDSSNYKNSAFKCTSCYKGFLDEDAYNGHMAKHTNQCGEHECGICKTHFKLSHALRKHVTAHHTQRFSCNRCPYVTTHRQLARLHERWHKGTKYQCPHCQEEFVKFTTYMGHVRIKHPSDFVCELCGYSFISEKGIELHKKLKHRLESDEVPEDGPYCNLCSVKFVSAEAYRRHLNVSARHCNVDGDSENSNKPKKGKKPKEMKDKRSLEKSRDSSEKGKMYPSQIRKVEGPIPCEQCGLQLEDSRAYHGHFRRMHPDKNRTNYPSMKSPCMCELCGRMFQSYALLKDHSWVHTGERPFACDSCGKAFRMRQRLVAHRRVHSQRRATYGCALCGKHFSTNSNRQRHMFIHTGLKPFSCEMCGKCFKHASEKRAHVAYVHLKKPWPKRARAKRTDKQGQQQPLPQPLAGGASEMAIPPLWPPCEQKIFEVPVIEKQMY